MAENILEIKDLVVHYETEDGCVCAVNGLTFQIGKKKTLGLVGETGAGKTTTALSILNLVPNPPGVIKNGSITLDGASILELNTAQLEAVRGNDVAMIFQDPMTALNPVMTVGEQIAESIELHEKISKAEALNRAKEMLKVDSRSCLYPYRLLFHHEHLPSEHTAENRIPVHAISISAASQHIKFPGSTSAPLKNCKSLNLLPSSFFFFFIFFTFSISGDEESEE